MGDLKTAIIEIEKIEDSEKKVGIVTKLNLRFSIFKTKKDGSETKAFSVFKEIPDLYANNWEVAYSESPAQTGVYRNIVGIKPSADQPYMPSNGDGGASSKLASAGVAKENNAPATDWDKISWGKCKHAYLVEAYKRWLAKETGETTRGEIEEECEKWADMSMRKLGGTPTPNSPVNAPQGQIGAIQGDIEPPMPTDEDISVENIPF